MAMRRPNQSNLSEDDRRRLDSLLVAFDKEWTRTLLTSRIKDLPEGSALRREALIEFIKIDMEHQWRIGRRVLMESYLKAFPELGGRDAIPADLLLAEYMVRRQFDASTDLSAIVKRFPAQAEELRRLADEASETVPNAATSSFPPPNNATHAVRPGIKLGEYEVRELLGKGGMGQVYKAWHAPMQRFVAVKVISSRALNSPDAIRRFQREVRASAQMTHNNLVRAYDAGEQNGVSYLVMELITGRSLFEIVKESGPLPVRQAVQYVIQIAEGLYSIHQHGMVHRDIKPGNVMVDTTDAVKILDLGLTGFRKEMPKLTGDDTETLTTHGVLLGTLDFIAPEQALDPSTVDCRADIYSLGCSLYFLLSGKPPFSGGTAAQKIAAHLNRQPEPIGNNRKDVPAELEQVLIKMLQKEREYRFTDCAELISALRPFAPSIVQGAVSPQKEHAKNNATSERSTAAFFEQPTDIQMAKSAPTQTASTNRRRPLGSLLRVGMVATAGFAVAACLLLAIIIWSNSRPAHVEKNGQQSDSPLMRLSQKQIPEIDRVPWLPKELVAVLGQNRLRHWGSVYSIAFSPDGKRLVSGGDDGNVFVWDVSSGKAIHWMRRDVKHNCSHLANGGECVRSAVWAPNGQYIASGGDDYELILWDPQTGKPAPGNSLIRFDQIQSMTVTRDSRMLAIGCGPYSEKDSYIVLWDAVNRKELKKMYGHKKGVWSVAFSDDGKWLASASEDDTIRLWNVRNPKESTCTCTIKTKRGNTLAISPDGSLLAVGFEYEDYIMLWTISGGTIDQKAGTKLIGHTESVCSVKFSKNGRQLLSGSRDNTLRIWDLEKHIETKKFELAADVFDVAFSPDERTIAAGCADRTIRLFDKQSGKPLHNIAGHAFEVNGVAFSPDNALLASGGEDNTLRLWDLTNKEGPGQIRKTVNSEPYDMPVNCVRFSQDGKWLAFGGDNGIARLWDVKSWKEKNRFIGREGYVRSIDIFPKSMSRLLVAAQGNSANVWKLDLSLNEPVDVKVPERIFREKTKTPCAVWLPNGKSLATVETTNDDGMIALWNLGDNDRPFAVLSKHDNYIHRIAVSPNGKWLGSADIGGNIRLWKLDPLPAGKVVGARHVIQPAKAYSNDPAVMAFSPDSRVLAVTDHRNRLSIWSVEKGTQIGGFIPFPGPVFDVTFASDGRHLATANGNGTVYVLRLPQRK